MSATAATITTPIQPTKKPRLDFIDCLRGCAALYVVAYHLVLVPSPHLRLPSWLSPWLHNGGSGVTLFFIISAFTLCFTLDGRQDQPHSTYNFYVRRLFRILPLYYVWLLLMIGFSLWAYGGLHGIWVERKALVLYSTFTYNFFPAYREGLVWASWTLGVEMVFYAVFPFLFRVVHTLKSSLLFVIVTLLLAWGHLVLTQRVPALSGNLKMSIFYQLPIFALGMVTYFIYKRVRDQHLSASTKQLVLGAGVLLFFAGPYLLPANFPLPVNYVMALVYMLLFLGFSFYPTIFPVNRYNVFLGVISYSLYLNHPRLIYALNSLYIRIYKLPMAEGLHYLLSLFALLTPLMLLSYLTYRLIEKPMMDKARQFLK